MNSLRQAVEQAHPFTKREATLTSITGVSITVDYAVTPILNRNETLLLLEVHPRDRLMRITREEAQLSKQETTKLLVRGLAHEIKNPLGGIRGAAQLLSREPAGRVAEGLHQRHHRRSRPVAEPGGPHARLEQTAEPGADQHP